jgi:hypothetical protein
MNTSSSSATRRGPSSHREFFAKLYGSFDDNKSADKRQADDDVDDDIDVDSDTDISTNEESMSHKTDSSPEQKTSTNLPPLIQNGPGICLHT